MTIAVGEKGEKMPRLIDAEALAEKVYRAWDLWEKKGNDCFVFSDIITPMLISMPTVDAVEVVRCKDCKWKELCEAALEYKGASGYCSKGERKEDAKTD